MHSSVLVHAVLLEGGPIRRRDPHAVQLGILISQVPEGGSQTTPNPAIPDA